MYEEAQKLLDMAKDGLPVPEDVINEALFMVGDGACWRDLACPEIEEFLRAMRESGLL